MITPLKVSLHRSRTTFEPRACLTPPTESKTQATGSGARRAAGVAQVASRRGLHRPFGRGRRVHLSDGALRECPGAHQQDGGLRHPAVRGGGDHPAATRRTAERQVREPERLAAATGIQGVRDSPPPPPCVPGRGRKTRSTARASCCWGLGRTRPPAAPYSSSHNSLAITRTTGVREVCQHSG